MFPHFWSIFICTYIMWLLWSSGVGPLAVRWLHLGDNLWNNKRRFPFVLRLYVTAHTPLCVCVCVCACVRSVPLGFVVIFRSMLTLIHPSINPRPYSKPFRAPETSQLHWRDAICAYRFSLCVYSVCQACGASQMETHIPYWLSFSTQLVTLVTCHGVMFAEEE
jgi:hypothetical protein